MKIFKYNKKTLNFESIKSYKLWLSIISALLILFLIGWASGTNKYIINKIVNKTEITDTLVVHGQKFSEEALVELLKDCHVKFPYIVLAQAKLESGNFTSKLFKNNNNMFGMRKARQRVTTAQGEKNEYAYYRDWIDCVYDYAMWSTCATSGLSTENDYFNKLSERYAEDSTYVIKLKDIIKKEKLERLFEDQ